MKNLLKIVSIFVLSLFVIASCSRDDDPADNDFFVGTYNGSVSYNDGSNNINTADGKVIVSKIASGTKYNFTFSNGIPALNGIEFQKTGDNTLINVGSTATTYIKIDNNDLDILYIKDGKTWTANCTR
jgi:hypothetical protein